MKWRMCGGGIGAAAVNDTPAGRVARAAATIRAARAGPHCLPRPRSFSPSGASWQLFSVYVGACGYMSLSFSLSLFLLVCVCVCVCLSVCLCAYVCDTASLSLSLSLSLSFFRIWGTLEKYFRRRIDIWRRRPPHRYGIPPPPPPPFSDCCWCVSPVGLFMLLGSVLLADGRGELATTPHPRFDADFCGE